ncbi:GtrA family protein [Actinosynnema sp. NPDC020468]|uniref:GtrA family protein n=1 Tax=Actinosynnema sp. NPDC020468 TaxID=3154488 RepID=UPI0033C4ED7C
MRALGGQLLRFAVVGAVSTLAYLVLYSGLRGVMGPFAANSAALLVTAVANTAANRRLTFGRQGRAGLARQHVEGLVVFGLGLGLTNGALALLGAGAPPVVELVVLVLASVTTTLARFAVLRYWVFHPRRD